MEADFTIKQGSRLPGIQTRLTGPNVHLASAVEFRMKQVVASGTPLLKNGTGGIDDATVTDKVIVHYDWGVADTDTVGIWLCEWWLTIAGKLMKLPNDEYTLVEVKDDAT